VKIDCAGHKEIMYKPGDHLSVFPLNDSSLVEGLLNRIEMDVSADDPVRMEVKERK